MVLQYQYLYIYINIYKVIGKLKLLFDSCLYLKEQTDLEKHFGKRPWALLLYLFINLKSAKRRPGRRLFMVSYDCSRMQGLGVKMLLAWGWGAAGGQFSGARCFDLMQKTGREIEVITANYPFRVLALPGPCCFLQAQEWRSICFCSAEISRT